VETLIELDPDEEYTKTELSTPPTCH